MTIKISDVLFAAIDKISDDGQAHLNQACSAIRSGYICHALNIAANGLLGTPDSTEPYPEATKPTLPGYGYSAPAAAAKAFLEEMGMPNINGFPTLAPYPSFDAYSQECRRDFLWFALMIAEEEGV